MFCAAAIQILRLILPGETPTPLGINVDGEAGTGKSHLIGTLSKSLNEMAEAAGKPMPLVRAAPTGVAAFNINGRTTYTLLKLPVRRTYAPLPVASLTPLQEKFKDVHYLVLDEKSMIGCAHLYWIDQRLRQIYPSRADEPFGGLNILLAGDFYQLPPVGQVPLYQHLRPSINHEIHMGRAAYLAIKQTVVLDQIMRQGGDDPESCAFRLVLKELRDQAVICMWIPAYLLRKLTFYP